MSKKHKPENRLSKLIDKQDPLANELQMIMPPAIFGFVELICKAYLDAAKQDQPSRDLIARLAFAMRNEAFVKFGHDTLETFALGKMLRATNLSVAERKGRLDSLSHINGYANKNHRLSAEQSTAATYIMSVWEAFGKFRMIGSRGFDGGSSRSTQVLQPLDVMGEELHQHYRQIYTPWVNEAQKITIARLHKHGAVNLAAIIFKVFVEDFYPEQIDGAFGLPKGSGLKAVKWGLSHYWAPEKLANWEKPSESAKEARPAALPAGDGKEPRAA